MYPEAGQHVLLPAPAPASCYSLLHSTLSLSLSFNLSLTSLTYTSNWNSWNRISLSRGQRCRRLPPPVLSNQSRRQLLQTTVVIVPSIRLWLLIIFIPLPSLPPVKSSIHQLIKPLYQTRQTCVKECGARRTNLPLADPRLPTSPALHTLTRHSYYQPSSASRFSQWKSFAERDG